jgi:hypothetical protein
MPERAVIVTSRVVAGVVGIAVAAAAITGAALLPLPTLQRTPASVAVTPQPADKQLVCPGAVLQLGDIGGQNASVASPIGAPTLSLAASAGNYATDSLRQQGAAADAQGYPTLVTAPAATEARIAGAQYQTVNLDDYRGLAAAACAQPSSDTWLVGGSTAVGRTTLITLANPGTVDSTVSLELFSGDGAVEAPGLTGIVVAANGQRVLSLAGFGPGLPNLTVHVTSRGGPVVATLQESIVRGIEPGGVDLIGTTSAPNTVNVIPGVLVLQADAVAGRLGEEGFSDLDTVLRVYVPGDVAVQASVRVIPEGDLLTGASFDLVLDPGVVSDVPIEGLVDGSYSVVVETSVPVVTAMRVSTVAATSSGSTPAKAADVAWFAAATVLSESVFASVASGPGASLHLVNPGDSAATVTVGATTVSVAAGASVTVPVTQGESLSITGAEGLFGSISFGSAGRLASYLLSSVANSEAPVTVYPG